MLLTSAMTAFPLAYNKLSTLIEDEDAYANSWVHVHELFWFREDD